MKRLACLFALVAASACTSPRIVDCAPGRFVRHNDLAWCIYGGMDGTCPRQLPEEHDLPWGGRGCAEDAHDPLPDGLCEAAGACGDAG